MTRDIWAWVTPEGELSVSARPLCALAIASMEDRGWKVYRGQINIPDDSERPVSFAAELSAVLHSEVP